MHGPLNVMFSHGSRKGWVVNAMSQLLSPWKQDPIPIVQEAEWALGPLCTGSKNLAPTRVQNSGYPALS